MLWLKYLEHVMTLSSTNNDLIVSINSFLEENGYTCYVKLYGTFNDPGSRKFVDICKGEGYTLAYYKISDEFLVLTSPHTSSRDAIQYKLCDPDFLQALLEQLHAWRIRRPS